MLAMAEEYYTEMLLNTFFSFYEYYSYIGLYVYTTTIAMTISVQNRSKRDVSVASADSESSSRTPSGSRSSFVNPQRGKRFILENSVFGHIIIMD